MKRWLFPLILVISMLFSLSGGTNPVRAVNLPSPLDVDQDGIPSAMEMNGWYNLTGGPYVTNPNMADSDHDGLTDSEEKLFNTNPLDANSPGIGVQYDSSFKTLKYFSANDPAYLRMLQGGSRYLMTEAAVIRRGATLKISAVNALSATLTITGANMTALTPVRDPARGGWLVTIPANGTVGTYTATISNNGWTKSMPIYVIFELPTNLTKAQTDAYLYDDNPASRRDQVAVWWRAVDYQYFTQTDPTSCVTLAPGVCSNWAYHTMTGYAQAFYTEQYTKKVLVDYTIPVIQGKNNALEATTAIGTLADESVWVNFYGVKNSFSSATASFWALNTVTNTWGWHMAGGACETQAGVYTSMLRSVGIASRPFALDYNKTQGAHGEDGSFGRYEYDHAVMMWVNGQWYAQRTFMGSETSVEYNTAKKWPSEIQTPLAAPSLLAGWHSKFKFQDTYADVIQAANEGWDFQNGSIGGGMVNEAWDATASDVASLEFTNRNLNLDFFWDSKSPLKMTQQSPYMDVLNCQLWKGDQWAPIEWINPAGSNPTGRDALHTYNLPGNALPDPTNSLENWPYNPQPTACSPSSVGTDACNNFKAAWAATCAALPNQSFAAAQPTNAAASQPSKTALNHAIQLGSISADAGQDLNGDGRIDRLNVQLSVTSAAAGKYQLGGWLKVGDHSVRSNSSQVDLSAGTQTATISFDGLSIGKQHVDGPYQVEALWVAPADQAVSEMALPEEMAAYQTYTYATQAYPAGTFTVVAAALAGNYSYTGTDANAGGLFGSIVVSVPLNIAIPSTFTLEGDLYDGQGGFVGHAAWTGSDPAAVLKFVVKGTVGPYSLEHVNLSDTKGNLLAAAYASVYKITDLNGKVNPGNVTLGNPSSGMSTQALTPSNLYTLATVDLNANGRFDQVVISTTVNVTGASGSYWMEGLLVDEHNLPVAWSVGSPKIMEIGNNQTLSMTFEGAQLFDYLPLTSGQKFTLTAVKIFNQSVGTSTPELNLPITGFSTPSYMRSNLEPSYKGSTLFQDDMEGTTAKWSTSGTSQWSQTSSFWRSFSQAWLANGSNSKNGLLTFAAPLDLSGYTSPWLWFSTAYEMADGQSTTLEASTDGSNWAVLKTFSGSTDYWDSEIVDLSAYAKKAGVRIRFNAQSNPNLIWAIDDVFVNAGPAVTSASFSHTPIAQVGKETTFTADFVSGNKNLPITYLWDFCGTSRQVSTPSIAYMFVSKGNCVVKLTVSNTFDSADAAPQTIVVSPGTLHYFFSKISK